MAYIRNPERLKRAQDEQKRIDAAAVEIGPLANLPVIKDLATDMTRFFEKWQGAKGAFVSRWQVRKSDLEVLNGEDLIRSVYLWDAASQQYVEAAGAGFEHLAGKAVVVPAVLPCGVTQQRIFTPWPSARSCSRPTGLDT